MVSYAGFVAFIRNQMQINTTALPDASPDILAVYNLSLQTVNQVFGCVGGPLGAVPVYDLMVFNLGGDFLINYANDTPPSTFFADAREKFKINSFIAGVISESHDEATGQSMTVSKAFENFTLSDLQNLKTPWGRFYLQFAQKYGTDIWGLS